LAEPDFDRTDSGIFYRLNEITDGISLPSVAIGVSDIRKTFVILLQSVSCSKHFSWLVLHLNQNTGY